LPFIRAEQHAPLAASLAALIVGGGLYLAVPKGDLGSDAAAARTPDVAAVGTVGEAGATSGGFAAGGTTSSSFGGMTGSPAALVQAVIEGTPPSTGGDTAAVPDAPDAPEVPACPSEAASDAADDLRAQVAEAAGQPIPGDALGDLAAIAAGCSTESPTGPVLRLALELARLVPETGLPPVETPTVPLPVPPEAPVPPEVVDALAPAGPVVVEACGAIGMLGLLVGLVPGAAGVELYDSNAITVVGYGAALCGQFEPPT
jgi:hypothetical protein